MLNKSVAKYAKACLLANAKNVFKVVSEALNCTSLLFDWQSDLLGVNEQILNSTES